MIQFIVISLQELQHNTQQKSLIFQNKLHQMLSNSFRRYDTSLQAEGWTLRLWHELRQAEMHKESGPQIHTWKHTALDACVMTKMPMDTTKALPVEANALNKRHNTCFIKGVSIKLCCLSRIKQQWRPYFALNENRSLGYCKLLQLLCQRSTHNEGRAPLLKLWTVIHICYSSYYHICSVHNSCTAYKTAVSSHNTTTSAVTRQ